MDLLQLFDEHHAPLFRFAYRLTGSIADAEDIVQACFLELLRPECCYDPVRAPLRTWLFGIVRNQSLKWLRQNLMGSRSPARIASTIRSPLKPVMSLKTRCTCRFI